MVCAVVAGLRSVVLAPVEVVVDDAVPVLGAGFTVLHSSSDPASVFHAAKKPLE